MLVLTRPGISHEVGDTSSTIARMYHHMVSHAILMQKKVDGKFHHPENYCGHMRCEHEFLTELQKIKEHNKQQKTIKT